MQLQKLWRTMDSALTSTLNENKGLGNYEDLVDTYSAKATRVPPLGHTQINDATNTCNNYTRFLRDHLLKENKIGKETSHKTYKCLIENQLNKDGFKMITNSIVSGSPQLSGEEMDLTEYVSTLEI